MERRERLTHRTLSESQNSYGEPSPTWTDGSTYWGAVLPESASERVRAGRVEGRALYRVVMDYYDAQSIATDDRLYWEDETKVLHVHATSWRKARRGLTELTCSEVTP